MRNLIKSLVVCASVLVFSTQVMAADRIPGSHPHLEVPIIANDGTSFSAEDLTGPATTGIVNVRGFVYLTFYVSVAAVTGTADVTITCNSGPSATDVNYTIQSESISSGVATYSDYTVTKSVTTADKFPATFIVLNKDYVQCTFTSASGAVDVTARAQ